MQQNQPPANVASTAELGQAPERAAFEAWFLARYSYTRAVLTNPIWAREIADAKEAFAAGRAAERERWQRIAGAAQAVTTGCGDKIDYFELPSHLMAALALALDEGPNGANNRP